MNTLRNAIFSEVRTQHKKSSALSDEELEHLIFHTSTSLRLTYPGFLILKNIFTIYSFDIPVTIKTKHRYGMSKMVYPYYFTRNRLILFSEMDAMTIKLCGGIERFLENCGDSQNI